MLHSCLAGSLDNDAVPGSYRGTPTFVTGSEYKFPDPEDVPQLMANLISSYSNAAGRFHPAESAARFHAGLVTIHPFADGNGRVARLAANTVLIQNSFLPTSIPPIFRRQYITATEKSHRDPLPFVEFFSSCCLNNMKDFMRFIRPGGVGGVKVRDMFE